MSNPLAFVRWLTIENAGSDPIPPFGIVRITGVASAGDAFTVDAPNASGMVGVLINGPGAVAPGSRGMAHATFPGLALYYTGDGTPAVGETWGTESGSYKLHSGQSGFKILGGVAAGKVCVQADWGGSGTAGASTIEEVDGSPSYTSTTTLRFDQADGFVLTQPGAGIVRVDLAAATTSQAGIVSTGAQSLAGEKWFQATQVRVGGNISTYGQSAYYTDMSGGRVTGYEGGGVLYDIGPGTRGASFELIYNGAGAIYACLVKGSESTYAYAVWDGVSLYPGVTGVRSDGLTSVGGIVTALGSPSTYTDEQAQDAVGAMVGGTTGLAYTDATPLLAINVTGLTGADPALADELAGYDASGSATRKFQVDRLLGLSRRSPGGRLTLGTGDPEYMGGGTGTTIYYTPYLHDCIELWDGTRWVALTFAETSLSTGGGGSGGYYDLFGYLSSGALSLEKLAWTNATTRATAITYSGMDGRLCKSGAKDRLYLGTFYQDNAAGTVTDTAASRLLWNMYNRIPKKLAHYNTSGHTYGTASYRSWNNDATVGYSFVCGRPTLLHNAIGSIGYAAGASIPIVACGYDSTSAADYDLGCYLAHYDNGVSNVSSAVASKHITTPGFHTVYGIQYSYGAGAYFHEIRIEGLMEF